MPVRRALNFILTISPGGWALAYAGAFIAYALAYLILARLEPHSFHQAAVASEPRYQAEERYVSRTLLEDVREMFSAGADTRKQAGNYIVRTALVSLDSLDIGDSRQAQITVSVPICDLELGCGSAGFPAWTYRLLLRSTGRWNPAADRVVFEIDDVSAKSDRIWFHYPSTRPALSDEAIAARIRQVVEGQSLLFPTSGDTFAFQVPRSSRELGGLMEEMGGWPSPDTAEFAVRMFHLSATTITTTGYGDIVPLTTMARILTGSEALLGTILMGLFIYAFPHHRAARRAHLRHHGVASAEPPGGTLPS